MDAGLSKLAGELAAAILPPPARRRRARNRTMIERLATRAADATSHCSIASLRSDRGLLAGRCRRRPATRAAWQPGPGGPRWSVPLPDGRWIVARAPPRFRNPFIGLIFFLGAHRAGGRALRLSGRARPDAAAGAPADRRRNARRRQTVGAREGRRPRRGGAPRNEFQCRRRRASRTWSMRIACCWPTPRMNCARRWRASGSGSSFSRRRRPKAQGSDLERDIAELDGLLDEILLASRLEVIRRCSARMSTCSRSPPRKPRITTRLRRRGRRRHHSRRCAAAAPPDPQPARKRKAPRQAAGARRRAPRRRPGGDRCDRLRPRRSARRPRADLRAVSPARRRVVRRGPWLVALPPDRAAARRRCGRRRARGCAQRLSRDAADQSSLKPYSGTLPELP